MDSIDKVALAGLIINSNGYQQAFAADDPIMGTIFFLGIIISFFVFIFPC